MKKYYAAHFICPDEIAVFESEEDRDRWVNYQDEFCKGEEAVLQRVPLTEEEARTLVGDCLDDETAYIKDELLDWVLWCAGENDGDVFSYLAGEHPTVSDVLGKKF